MFEKNYFLFIFQKILLWENFVKLPTSDLRLPTSGCFLASDFRLTTYEKKATSDLRLPTSEKKNPTSAQPWFEEKIQEDLIKMLYGEVSKIKVQQYI